jgi:hypothetical protein
MVSRGNKGGVNYMSGVKNIQELTLSEESTATH